MTQRNGLGREVGQGFRMGNTWVHPWQIHVNVWQNQYNIVYYKEMLASQSREKDFKMAVAKRQGREKPAKTEQRKFRGPE